MSTYYLKDHGIAANRVESIKVVNIDATYFLVLIGIETTGVFGVEAYLFLLELAGCLKGNCDESLARLC